LACPLHTPVGRGVLGVISTPSRSPLRASLIYRSRSDSGGAAISIEPRAIGGDTSLQAELTNCLCMRVCGTAGTLGYGIAQVHEAGKGVNLSQTSVKGTVMCILYAPPDISSSDSRQVPQDVLKDRSMHAAGLI
jgi:hypothetical protein